MTLGQVFVGGLVVISSLGESGRVKVAKDMRVRPLNLAACNLGLNLHGHKYFRGLEVQKSNMMGYASPHLCC